MNELPQIILKPGKEKSVLRRHPWIFSGAIDLIDENIAEGDIAQIRSSKGVFLGIGHYQIGSIAVRLFSFDNIEITNDFWHKKFLIAKKLRETAKISNNSSSNIFRLINAEGDGLPGLICDFYDNNLVLQAHSIGMHRLLNVFADILVDLFDKTIKSVYDKSKPSLPYNSKEKSIDGFCYGSSTEIIACENNLKFKIDIIEGQKTGFYIDQRENRNLLSNFCFGKKVLNAFSYSGGFSVYALKGGASMVHSVDSSIKAIELTEENIKINFLPSKNHASYCEDVFKFFDKINEEYEVLIIDPPAFSKHLNSLNQAIKGYIRLNTLALGKASKGAVIFTFSCSQVLSLSDFRTAIYRAAQASGKNIRILYRLSQPADHPVSIYHPEGEYLKGFVLLVD